jgi:hypothetical protein
MIIDLIKKGVNVLKNPEKEFQLLKKRTLESVIFDYLWLLLFLASLTSIVNFFITIVNAVYFDIFLTLDVNYLRLIDYSFTMLLGTIYFCLILGTIFSFFLSIVLKFFITKIKYTELLKIICYAFFPILLFGWIPKVLYGIWVWSLYLLIVGIKIYKTNYAVRKKSIEYRG